MEVCAGCQREFSGATGSAGMDDDGSIIAVCPECSLSFWSARAGEHDYSPDCDCLVCQLMTPDLSDIEFLDFGHFA